jgi:ATP-dependent helicase/nuclease subunit B
MSITRFDIKPLLTAIDQDALILVPNHSIRDAILASHAAQSRSDVFRTPRVYAIDVWIRDMWELAANRALAPCCEYQLIDAAAEHFIWTGIIESSLKALPLLNPDETARVVGQSYRSLRQWLNDDHCEEELLRSAAIADIAAFLNWRQLYQNYCEEHKLISLVDCTHMLVSELDRLGLIDANEAIVLVAFFQPPPLYKTLFDKLANMTQTHMLQQNQQLSAAPRRRVEFADENAEIQYCVQWAKALQTKATDTHIGIISNQDARQRTQLERVLQQVLIEDYTPKLTRITASFNSSMSSQKLIDAGIIHDAFLLLNLGRGLQDSEEFCRILRSPFIAADSEERQARVQMESFMRRHFSSQCDLAEISRLLNTEGKPYHCPLLGAGLLRLSVRARSFKGLASSAHWAPQIDSLLQIFGWQATANSRSELEALAQWRDALELFARSGVCVGKISFATAVSRMRALCAQQSRSLRFQPGCQISVLSVSEAVGLKFDHLWLLGFDDRHWPATASPSPFLPYPLQRQAGMPGSHSEIQYLLAQQSFEILCDSVSQTLYASYHRQDSDQQLSPSSFIMDFPGADDQRQSKASVRSTDNTGSQSTQLIQDLSSFALKPGEKPGGGSRLISNQSSCPFRAFAVHRLNATDAAEFEAGLNSMARGIAIHVALERLFASIQSHSELLALSIADRQRLAAQASSHAITELRSRFPLVMTPKFAAIENDRIQQLLLRFMALESERENFEVVSREQAQQWCFEGLSLNLKIDRVDRLADSSLALIDYKTGRYAANHQSWHEARPEDLQLPLYHVVATQTYGEAISAVTIGHLNIENVGYSGIVASDGFHSQLKPARQDVEDALEWDQLTNSWREKIELFAEEFSVGKANVSPVNASATCRYCELKALCRVQEIESRAASQQINGETS